MTNKVPEQEKSQLNGSAAVTEHDLQEQDSELFQTPETPKTRRNWLSGGRGVLIGLGAGILLAVGGMRLLGSQQPTAPAKKPPTAASSAPAQSVTVATVETKSVSRTLEATGSVAAFELIPVSPQATGLQIKEVLVDQGDFVKAGQVMARLDDAVLQAQLTQARGSVAQAEARLTELQAGTRKEEIAQAQARLEQAQARLRQSQASIPRQIEQAEAQVASAQARLNLAENRYRSNESLVNQGAVARDRFNEALSDYQSAQASLSEAQQRLAQARNTNNPEIDQLVAAVSEATQQLNQLRAGSRPEAIAQAQAQLVQAKGQVQATTAQLTNTRVIAPVNGKVAQRNARVGDVSSSSTKLFTIIQNGRLELLLKVPETQLKQISPGQDVKITSNKDSKLSLQGKVREIEPLVNEESRQATLKVDIPAEESLRPGMFVRAAIITSAVTGLTLPSKAVLPQADGSAIVYKLQRDGTVKAQPVQLGEIMSGERVEIKSGLSAGDRVVVKGAPYLKDGDKVEIRG
ncbi:MAG TPA: efflux RND transporter periplasmic adaptor subunit [Coleofasciculaceae cyanobacterium]